MPKFWTKFTQTDFFEGLKDFDAFDNPLSLTLPKISEEISKKIDSLDDKFDLFFKCLTNVYSVTGEPLTPDSFMGRVQARRNRTIEDFFDIPEAIVELIEDLRERNDAIDLALLDKLKSPKEFFAGLRKSLPKAVQTVRGLGHHNIELALFDETNLGDFNTIQFPFLLRKYIRAFFGDRKLAFSSKKQDGGRTNALEFVQSESSFFDIQGAELKFPGLSAGVVSTVKGGEGAFPSGINVRFNSASEDVSSTMMVKHILRIFLEAFFDNKYRVPAVQNSTAAIQIENTANNNQLLYPTQADDEKYSDHYSFIKRTSRGVESLVTNAVGGAIRGGTQFSLNNETAAAAVETAAGVIAKKQIEHIMTCYMGVKHYHAAPNDFKKFTGKDLPQQ